MFRALFGLKNNPPPTLPPVKLFNTESAAIEDLVPLSPPRVLMYSCGPTVYDFAHIGNLRSYVFVDILKRVLIHHGYEIDHTINLTDFGHLSDDGDAGEDKMMKGLRREGLPITLAAMRSLSDIYIKAFKEDIDTLRILPPTTFSRASDYLKAQISLIETLAEKGYAYETSDGLYFDISRFPSYGRLGHIDVAALKSGARVEANPEKRHPADFALWKKGLLGWESRWGKGFPGWHIECSAMAMATLGKQIDIHTGGIDHIHTHHNAEIAQSEAATGKRFVRYWLHNAFITIDNAKIAKSLGNTITLRHLADRGYSGDEYRYWLLTAHYRSPVNFTWEALSGAKQALYRLKRLLFEELGRVNGTPHRGYLDRFSERASDDLDTPGALAVLWEAARDASLAAPEKRATLLAMDALLDIGLSDDPEEGARSLGIIARAELPKEVEELVTAREAARVARNWLEADRLREALNLKGYLVEDTPHGPKVTKAT